MLGGAPLGTAPRPEPQASLASGLPSPGKGTLPSEASALPSLECSSAPLAAALLLLFLRGLPRRSGELVGAGQRRVSAGGHHPPPQQALRPVSSADPD